MGKRTFSSRSFTRDINNWHKEIRKKNEKIKEIIINYLDNNELNSKVLYTVSELSPSKTLTIKYNGVTILFNKDSYQTIGNCDGLESIMRRLDVLQEYLPPSPKQFDGVYKKVMNSDDKSEKIKELKRYFKKIPAGVVYKIQISANKAFEYCKKGRDIYFRETISRSPTERYYDKKNIYEIFDLIKAKKDFDDIILNCKPKKKKSNGHNQ